MPWSHPRATPRAGRQRRPAGRLGRPRRRSLDRAGRALRADHGRPTASGCSRPDSSNRGRGGRCRVRDGEADPGLARRASRGSALGVDLSRRMLTWPPRPHRGRGDHQRDVRAGGRRGPAVHAEEASTWWSAASVRCSSAIRCARSATSAGALRPGGRGGLLAWRELARNEWLSAICAAPRGRAHAAARRDRDARDRSGWRTPTRCASLLAGAVWSTSSSSRSTSR